MKNCASFALARMLMVSGLLCCVAVVVAAAPTKNTKASKGGNPAKAAANPAEPEVPVSVFTIPSNANEGKDPFFPKRSIVGVPSVPKTNKAPVVVPLKLQLNGLSGTREKPLAIINNRTFEKGEEAEITTASGRTRVRCVEIKEDSVLIEVNGQRQELRMRPGA